MATKYIYCNNNNSYDDFGLILNSIKLPTSNKAYEEVEVEGRNGNLLIDKKCYKDKEIPVTLTLIKNKDETIEDFSERIEVIENWLRDTSGDLITYLKPNKKYIVKKVILGEIETDGFKIAVFNVTFICEPFLYDLEETAASLSETPTTINYPGTVEGECKIKIIGSGNIQLTINDDTVQINNVSTSVTIDSKLFLCLDNSNNNKSKDMIGDFLLLEKGVNNISWTALDTNSYVTSIEILPRTAYIGG